MSRKAATEKVPCLMLVPDERSGYRLTSPNDCNGGSAYQDSGCASISGKAGGGTDAADAAGTFRSSAHPGSNEPGSHHPALRAVACFDFLCATWPLIVSGTAIGSRWRNKSRRAAAAFLAQGASPGSPFPMKPPAAERPRLPGARTPLRGHNNALGIQPRACAPG